ncbi:unnamed protein product, partial [Discosporangium mesarthrocarpum]
MSGAKTGSGSRGRSGTKVNDSGKHSEKPRQGVSSLQAGRGASGERVRGFEGSHDRVTDEKVAKLFDTILPLLRDDTPSMVVWDAMKILSLDLVRQHWVAKEQWRGPGNKNDSHKVREREGKGNKQEGQKLERSSRGSQSFKPFDQLKLVLGHLGGRNPVLLSIAADFASSLIQLETDLVYSDPMYGGEGGTKRQGPVGLGSVKRQGRRVRGAGADGETLWGLVEALADTMDEHLRLDLLGVLGTSTVAKAAAMAAMVPVAASHTGGTKREGVVSMGAEISLARVVKVVTPMVVRPMALGGPDDSYSQEVTLLATGVLSAHALAIFRETECALEAKVYADGVMMSGLTSLAEAAADAVVRSTVVQDSLLGRSRSGGAGAAGHRGTATAAVVGEGVGERCIQDRGQDTGGVFDGEGFAGRRLGSEGTQSNPVLVILRALAMIHPRSQSAVIAAAVKGLLTFPPGSPHATCLAVLLSHVMHPLEA